MAGRDEREILVDLGRIAYDAYLVASRGRSMVTAAALPAWENQSPEIRECWRMAADGVRMWLDSHPRAEEAE